MKNRILLMGVALAALTPSIAYAQDCDRQRSGRVAATVGGAAVGAVAGAVVTGRNDNTEGAIIGGVLGAIAGNQIAKPDNDCKRAYGWYDKEGRWHATGVSASNARGYYNRDGDWVSGRPSGYYDNGRWVATSADADGYYDRDGHFVPVGAQGYYDRQGRYVTGTQAGYWANGRWNEGASQGYYDSRGRWTAGESPYARNGSYDEQPGYYDSRGRWVAGRTYGYYDSRGRWVTTRGSTGSQMGSNDNWENGTQAGYWQNGRWIAGPSRGYYDSRGRWIAGESPYARNGSMDEQPGYYDSRGRWIAGRTYGYYDDRGRWVATRGSTGSQIGSNDRYNDRWDTNNAPTDASGRIAWLRDQVNGGSVNLSREESAWARRELTAIESQHRMFERSGGELTVREETQIDTRLDRLSRRIERASVTAYNN